jgi:hypothetical protein
MSRSAVRVPTYRHEDHVVRADARLGVAHGGLQPAEDGLQQGLQLQGLDHVVGQPEVVPSCNPGVRTSKVRILCNSSTSKCLGERRLCTSQSKPLKLLCITIAIDDVGAGVALHSLRHLPSAAQPLFCHPPAAQDLLHYSVRQFPVTGTEL